MRIMHDASHSCEAEQTDFTYPVQMCEGAVVLYSTALLLNFKICGLVDGGAHFLCY